MGKVSIIMTTYNHQEFIKEAIESIIAQNFSDWELLIWDDSPNNLTWKIIQSYQTKYPHKIKSWHHSPNKHIVWNINFLLSKTDPQTEFIAFLEWDDIRLSTYLQEKIDIFNQYSTVWLVYNDINLIDESWKTLEKERISARTKKRYHNETDSIDKLLLADMVCFSYSTLMARYTPWISINNRGHSELLWSETDFWLNISQHSNLYGIPKTLVLYRKHNNNTSKNIYHTISHYEYLIKMYIDNSIITKKTYIKISILILLMKAYVSLQHLNRFDTYKHISKSFLLSITQTFIVWFYSIYYRLLKPSLFKFRFVYIQWNK